MKIRLDDNVPMPAGRSSGTRESGALTTSIKKMKPGQSFFFPALDCTPAVLQRRTTVRSVQLRQSGAIDFYLKTSQTTETYINDDDEEVGPVDGVRIWRREREEDEIQSQSTEVDSDDAPATSNDDYVA